MRRIRPLPVAALASITFTLSSPVELPALQLGFVDKIFGKVETLSLMGGRAWIHEDDGLYAKAKPVAIAIRAGIWAGGTGCRNVSREAQAADRCEYDARVRAKRIQDRRRCMLRATGKEADTTALRVLAVDMMQAGPTDTECAALLSPPAEVIEVEETATLASGNQVTTRSARRRSGDTDYRVRYGVTLGYGQVLGLTGQGAGIEYSGGIEELPSLGVNLTVLTDDVAIYLGGKAGLNRLLGFRAFSSTPGTSTGTSYAASGTSIYLGAAAGVAIAVIAGAELFAEGSYTARNLKSIEWGASGATLPTALPRTLPLTVTTIELGSRIKL